MDQFRAGAGQHLHPLRHLNHAEFARVTKVHGAGEAVGGVHQTHEAFNQDIHITERARLSAVAVEGDGFVSQRLGNEVGHYAPVVGVHARAVGF